MNIDPNGTELPRNTEKPASAPVFLCLYESV